MSEIRRWLETLQLGTYAAAFEAEDIDLDALRTLSDDDLKELCLTMGPRRKVLAAIADAASAPAAEPSPASRDAERRQITVMFCDLIGSTALSERLDPEDLKSVMDGYRSAAGTVVERYDGTVAQYLGDGLMIYFGWPSAHEDDAIRAVRAGLDIVEVVKSIGGAPTPLAVRIGIATGLVVVGADAGDQNDARLAVGETPNIAARIQGLAEHDCVAIADSTRRLIGGAFELEDLGGFEVKGVTGQLQVYRVIDEASTESRFEAQAVGSLTSFVGRESEIATLIGRWNQAKIGEGQVVLLEGEAGIGKSRITQTLRERVAGEAHTRLRYQCSPYHRSSALYPVIQQIERASDFARDDDNEAKIEKLEAVLDEASEATAAPLIAAMLSLNIECYPALVMGPQKQKDETLKTLSDQVVKLAARQPVLSVRPGTL